MKQHTVGVEASAAPAIKKAMAITSPMEFIQQVRSEVAKVTWPSRRETLITSAMVVTMAVITSLFFLAADQVISRVIGFLLELGR